MNGNVDRLAAIVREMAAAPPSEVIGRYRRPLTDFGAAAIHAMAPVLADDQRRHSVALIIREMAKIGPDEQLAACEVLTNALREVRPVGQSFLIEVLSAAGCEAPDPAFEPGTKFTPIAGGVTAHHAVVDEITHSSTRFGKLYLVACRWVFSDEWVQAQGGLVEKHGGRYCWFCSRSVGRAQP